VQSASATTTRRRRPARRLRRPTRRQQPRLPTAHLMALLDLETPFPSFQELPPGLRPNFRCAPLPSQLLSYRRTTTSTAPAGSPLVGPPHAPRGPSTPIDICARAKSRRAFAGAVSASSESFCRVGRCSSFVMRRSSRSVVSICSRLVSS
jgi:hypothetical protein